MKIRINFIACYIFSFFVSGTLFADSFYSTIGIGIPIYHISAKANGMGGAGLALFDRLSLNGMNPAAINTQSLTSISVDYVYEMVDHRYQGQSVQSRFGNAAGFQFVVPLKQELVFLTSLKPLAFSRYTLSDEQNIGEESYQRLIRGTGGLNAAQIGLQVILTKWCAIAVQGRYHFGNYSEDWKTDFENIDFIDTTDKITSHLRGWGANFGVAMKPSKSWAIGIIGSPAVKLNVDNRATLGSYKRTVGQDHRITYPATLGLGLAKTIGKVTIAGDYFMQFWSKYRMDGQRADGYQDFRRMGGGIEYVDSTDPMVKYLRRILYRIGTHYAQLPYKNSADEPIDEFFVTAGLGFPFSINNGRIDIALELGQRNLQSSNVMQERIIRFSATITGLELWFQTRR